MTRRLTFVMREREKKLKIVSGCQPEFGNEVFDESYHGNWSYIAF
jgi:hypothetical protein